MKTIILFLSIVLITISSFSQKTVNNIISIVKNDTILNVHFTFVQGSVQKDTSVNIGIGLIDVSKMQSLIALHLGVNSDSISNFIYQAGIDALELNRRFLVNIKGRQLKDNIILNIMPQYKVINGVNTLINVSVFSSDEISNSINYIGGVIAYYIQNLINLKTY